MTDTRPLRDRTALVLGATGNIGSEVARQLSDAGWHMRALTRRPPDAPGLPGGIAWVQGDALREDDVRRAAQGCGVIVHAVNPPGYRHWRALALPMLAHTLAAAAAEHATVVLPGNVYNFGPDAFPLLHEDAPQHPRRARAPCAWRWSSACRRPARAAACAPSCCAPGTISARRPSTAGSRRGWCGQARSSK